MDQNFLDLLQCFEKFKVRYLIIGGYAVSFHAEPRYTKDIDFWVECSKANSKKIFQALDDFGAPMATINQNDFSIPGNSYTAGIPPIRFDILTKVSGGNFTKAYTKKLSIMIKKIPLHYISLKDLIVLKKAAASPQDLVDVKSLTRFSFIKTTS